VFGADANANASAVLSATNAAVLAAIRLSNHVRVPTPEESNGRPSDEALEQGVLSNLPRTRPQRATARRIAARTPVKPTGAAKAPPKAAPPKAAPPKAAPAKARASEGTSSPGANGSPRAASSTKARKSTSDAKRPKAKRTQAPPKRTQAPRKPRAGRSTTRSRTPTYEPAPRQGFEAEGERASGPVQPPGGAELVASAAEIVGEIAKAGVSAGERALRDVLSRLRP
jgi:hypothetical protein